MKITNNAKKTAIENLREFFMCLSISTRATVSTLKKTVYCGSLLMIIGSDVDPHSSYADPDLQKKKIVG